MVRGHIFAFWRTVCLPGRKFTTMKKLLFVLLFASAAVSAQKKVYNVQQYCIDEKPFERKTCDIEGNEYSFVFLDESKKEVTLFLSNTKMPFKIKSSVVSQADPQYRVYTILDEKGVYEMRLNRQGTKMEFHLPDNRIFLTVGASTKSLQ